MSCKQLLKLQFQYNFSTLIIKQNKMYKLLVYTRHQQIWKWYCIVFRIFIEKHVCYSLSLSHFFFCKLLQKFATQRFLALFFSRPFNKGTIRPKNNNSCMMFVVFFFNPFICIVVVKCHWSDTLSWHFALFPFWYRSGQIQFLSFKQKQRNKNIQQQDVCVFFLEYVFVVSQYLRFMSQ